MTYLVHTGQRGIATSPYLNRSLYGKADASDLLRALDRFCQVVENHPEITANGPLKDFLFAWQQARIVIDKIRNA